MSPQVTCGFWGSTFWSSCLSCVTTILFIISLVSERGRKEERRKERGRERKERKKERKKERRKKEWSALALWAKVRLSATMFFQFLAQCIAVLHLSSQRWLVEAFHMLLKLCCPRLRLFKGPMVPQVPQGDPEQPPCSETTDEQPYIHLLLPFCVT